MWAWGLLGQLPSLPSSAGPQATPRSWRKPPGVAQGGDISRADFLEEAEFGLGLKEGFRDARKEEKEPSRRGVPCQPPLREGHTAARMTLCPSFSGEGQSLRGLCGKGVIPEGTKRACPTVSSRGQSSPLISLLPHQQVPPTVGGSHPSGTSSQRLPQPTPPRGLPLSPGASGPAGREGPALCPRSKLRLTRAQC